MSEKTKIAWADSTWNPFWGCKKVSEGCKNCYAEKLANRAGFPNIWSGNKVRLFGQKHWAEPLKWERKAAETGTRLKVFPSMCDWCLDHPEAAKLSLRMLDLARRTPNLDWLLLTKRPERIEQTLPKDWSVERYPNVWLGVSVEDSNNAWRIGILREIDAAIRFISAEPLLGPIHECDLSGIDWVICGGESGPGYRYMFIGWAENLANACRLQNIPFFFKQQEGPRPGMNPLIFGKKIQEMPK